jgi:hypothetical protein
MASCQEAGQLSFDVTPTRRIVGSGSIACPRTVTAAGLRARALGIGWNAGAAGRREVVEGGYRST